MSAKTKKVVVSGEILKQTYATSPVPVFELSITRWHKHFYGHAPPNPLLGMYCNYPEGRDHPQPSEFPNRFIVIDPAPPAASRMYTFWHETGHDTCVFNRCFCMVHGIKKFQEIHAHRFALDACVRRGYLDAIATALRRIRQQGETHTAPQIREAARRVMRSCVWDDAVEFVGGWSAR